MNMLYLCSVSLSNWFITEVDHPQVSWRMCQSVFIESSYFRNSYFVYTTQTSSFKHCRRSTVNNRAVKPYLLHLQIMLNCVVHIVSLLHQTGVLHVPRCTMAMLATSQPVKLSNGQRLEVLRVPAKKVDTFMPVCVRALGDDTST